MIDALIHKMLNKGLQGGSGIAELLICERKNIVNLNICIEERGDECEHMDQRLARLKFFSDTYRMNDNGLAIRQLWYRRDIYADFAIYMGKK